METTATQGELMTGHVMYHHVLVCVGRRGDICRSVPTDPHHWCTASL